MPGCTSAREHATLALEPGLFARVDAVDRDDLERDGLARHLVVRAIDDAHAAATDLALDEEAAADVGLARERGHALAFRCPSPRPPGTPRSSRCACPRAA